MAMKRRNASRESLCVIRLMKFTYVQPGVHFHFHHDESAGLEEARAALRSYNPARINIRISESLIGLMVSRYRPLASARVKGSRSFSIS
jgi:hypothetical protein